MFFVDFVFFLMIRRPPSSHSTDTPFPYTTRYRSGKPADADPLELISGASVIREYRLRDVVHALETAAKDNRVKAVALDLDVFVGGGQAALSRVGEAIDMVRRANKPVIAYATGDSGDADQRSEERRVGNEGVRTGRSGGSQ